MITAAILMLEKDTQKTFKTMCTIWYRMKSPIKLTQSDDGDDDDDEVRHAMTMPVEELP